jgi:hypothetical protein
MAAKVAKKSIFTVAEILPGFKLPDATVAGALVDPKTKKPYRLELLDARPDEPLNWKAAIAWAKKLKADAPSRPELNLLRATLRAKFQDSSYWSNEPGAGNASYAWYQDFFNGGQWNRRKGTELLAVAVRRLAI